MTKLRASRLQKQPAGAFGVVKRQRPDNDNDERDARRAHIVEAVSSVWSYGEIRQFGKKQERERERMLEILDLFDEAQGHDRIEQAHFDVHQWRLGQKRERLKTAREIDHGAYKRMRAMAWARYQRWLAKHPRPKQAKLTREQARDIRRLYQTGLFQVDLAEVYGVSVSTISLLLKGRTWKDAGGPTIERATRMHRRLPLVRDHDAERKKANAKQARYRAQNPGYHAAKERERRQRDGDKIRTQDRERYRKNATKLEARRKAKVLAETPEERESRLAAHRERCNRWYARHKEEVLAKQRAGRRRAVVA